MTGSLRHQDMANALLVLTAQAVQNANSGHPGMPMGMADGAPVLCARLLNFKARDLDWP